MNLTAPAKWVFADRPWMVFAMFVALFLAVKFFIELKDVNIKYRDQGGKLLRMKIFYWFAVIISWSASVYLIGSNVLFFLAQVKVLH